MQRRIRTFLNILISFYRYIVYLCKQTNFARNAFLHSVRTFQKRFFFFAFRLFVRFADFIICKTKRMISKTCSINSKISMLLQFRLNISWFIEGNAKSVPFFFFILELCFVSFRAFRLCYD